MQKESFYVTSPIYYVNDVPHIGHAYSTIAADILARFHRVLGQEAFFLTGTDEHGQKVAAAAAQRNLTPKQHVDDMVKPYLKLWERLEISNDRFIRTTDPWHEEVVSAIFKKLLDQGDIYPSFYEGWYCVHEETFYPESQLKEGCCPECGRKVQWLKEESYHFRTSKFIDKLLDHIEKNDNFILPLSRRNETLSFIKSGVQDVSVSRTSFNWGVSVPSDPKHVVYVWFDALINYLSGIGYHPEQAKQKAGFKALWPANVHIIGKDIIKFHAVIWPAMLMALGLELPKMIFAHGFLTLNEEKISKSKGTVIDPNDLIDKYGADAFRYFLMSEFSFGQDGEYTEETLIKRINSDLANDLGNLVHRTANMIKKYFDGIVPNSNWKPKKVFIGELLSGSIPKQLSELAFKMALFDISALIGSLNKRIEAKAPWTLKKEGKEEELADVMYSLAEGIRIVAQLIYPYMPETAQKIWEQIGMDGDVANASFENIAKWGVLPAGSNFKIAEPLFPRIES